MTIYLRIWLASSIYWKAVHLREAKTNGDAFLIIQRQLPGFAPSDFIQQICLPGPSRFTCSLNTLGFIICSQEYIQTDKITLQCGLVSVISWSKNGVCRGETWQATMLESVRSAGWEPGCQLILRSWHFTKSLRVAKWPCLGLLVASWWKC